jgi:hypothetical protein
LVISGAPVSYIGWRLVDNHTADGGPVTALHPFQEERFVNCPEYSILPFSPEFSILNDCNVRAMIVFH